MPNADEIHPPSLTESGLVDIIVSQESHLPWLERQSLKLMRTVDVEDTHVIKIAKRMGDGFRKYGPLYPGKCDWADEMREELWDAIAYASFACVDESFEGNRAHLEDVITQLGDILSSLDGK